MNLDQLLPQVQKLVSEKTLQMLSKEGPKVAIKGIYNILPGAIRLFVKEEAFTDFCLTHQEKLFGKAKAPVKKTSAKTSNSKLVKAPTKSLKKKAVSAKKK